MLPYHLQELLVIAGIMGLGSIVQGAVAFASGLLGIPLLVLSGLSLPEAATINILSTSVQNIAGAVQLRQEVTWDDTWLAIVLRWLGIPVGVVALGYLHGHDQQLVKQVIGALLLATVLLLWTFRVQPRERLGLPWRAMAFSTSGFLMGLAAMGGGPLVVYVNSLHWSAARSRAFLFFTQATGIPIVLALFAWRFGASLLPATVAAFLVLPIVIVGMNLGFYLGRRISKPLFRQVTFALLMLIAVSAILSPYL